MIPDFLVSLSANLAFQLMQAAGGRLRQLVLGTAEQQALQTAWQTAFERMLVEIAPRLAKRPDEIDETLAQHTADIFVAFIQAEDVAATLLDAALVGQTPPLKRLARRFDALEFNRKTLPVNFRRALLALTAGLTDALIQAATEANSPLHNRVHIVRLMAMQQMLAQQSLDLEQMTAQLTRLDAAVQKMGRGKYNMLFLGPVAGFAVGDGAATSVDADLRPLLEEALAQISRLAAPPATPPYTDEDKAAYLQAVVDECRYIRLPYAAGSGRAVLPLREIYVALKADRSSPVERQASYQLFQKLIHEAAPDRRQLDDDLVARLAALDPYAGRFLIYNPDMWAQLLVARQDEEERSYDLTEILRQHRWLVLLGDPGSGKSTLARWLALHLALALQQGDETATVRADHARPDGAADELESLGVARLPVLVRLADYAAARWPASGTDTRLPLRLYMGQHLDKLMEPGRENRAVYNLVKDYLVGGRVAFILDGLDEVTSLEQRQAIAGEIEILIEEWLPEEDGQTPLTAAHHRLLASSTVSQKGNQIIVTSRIVGYQLFPLHANLPHFIIQPMDDTAVYRFCHNWAKANGLADKAAALVRGVLKHPNPNVREQMARNPLLLTILAQVFSQNPDAGLPARRAELYEKAQAAVFGQREAGRWPLLSRQLPAQDLPPVLTRLTARVAYELHANPDYPNSLADKRALQGWLSTGVAAEPGLQSGRNREDVVNELLDAAAQLSGFLVARGEGVYGFLHRQFQEYFSAVYLAQQARKESGPARWQPLLARLNDPAWYEVILLAAGILERTGGTNDAAALLTAILDAPDPVAGVLPHNLLLMATALPELERSPESVVERVAAGLIAAYQRDNEARSAALQKLVAAAFERLPRPQGQRDPVGKALCQALTAAAGDDEPGRFLRLAAAELILETKWYTPAVTRALAAAYRAYSEPAATLLLALQLIHQECPGYFSGRFLPVRRQWTKGWQEAAQGEAWAAVLHALYLSPYPKAIAADQVVRDSPLTDGLQKLLTPVPASRETLLAWLRRHLVEQVGVSQRDAGVALWYLGDSETLLPFLLKAGRDDEMAVFYRSLIALADLDLALARDLSLARARARARDLDLDLSLARARARALDRDQDLVLDLDRAYALARDLDRALTLDRNLARARDLDRDHPLTYLIEIGAILEKALVRPNLPAEMQEQLQQNQVKWRQLRAWLTQRQGLWQIWQSWHKSLATQPERLDWSGSGRMSLTLNGLKQLAEQLAVEGINEQWSRLDFTRSANLPDTDRAAARAILTECWQTADDDTQPHIALMLAEMKVVQPDTLPLLLQSLNSSNDLIRYRAQTAIQAAFAQPASVIGRETIEALARYETEGGSSLVSTYQNWALTKIHHDQPEWLQAWIEVDDNAIPGLIHYLDKNTWLLFVAGLRESDAPMQVKLLESVSQLLRTSYKNIPAELPPTLLSLCRHENPQVQQAAFAALGYWHYNLPAAIRQLLILEPPKSAASLAAYLTAVARLTGRNTVTDLISQALTKLRQHWPTTAALAALARLLIMQQNNKTTLPVLWAFVADNQAAVPAADLLSALLQAGTDSDEWDSYHTTIVRLIRELVEQEEGLLDNLLTALQEALEGDSWPERRIALAGVAACAAVMPDALNHVWPAEEVTELLVAGTKDAGSFTSRRFGILALSHLRLLTPGVLAALLAAAYDIVRVQQDAITAAGNFRRLHPDFSDEAALSSLVAALQGESGAAAYLAAQVLAALGSSPAVVQIPGLRARIAQALSEASQNERAQEMVYLLEDSRGDDNIKEMGTRAQVILDALSRVWALPGR